MTDTDRSIGTVKSLIADVPKALALLVGLRIEVFTYLQQPRSIDELSRLLEAPTTRGLEPLLDLLVTAGLVERRSDGFTNTPAAAGLVHGHAEYIGEFAESLAWLWTTALRTPESIRSGRPCAKLDWSLASGEEWEVWLRGFHPNAQVRARDLLREPTLVELFGSASTIIDIGAGTGALAIAIAQQCKRPHVTLGDLPAVLDVARAYVEDAGLQDRISLEALNILEGGPPVEYDVAVLSAMIQVVDVEGAQETLLNTAKALRPGGSVVIAGHVLDDDRNGPPFVAGFNLAASNTLDAGGAYTQAAYFGWLEAAGFEDPMRLDPGGFDDACAIVAKKPS